MRNEAVEDSQGVLFYPSRVKATEPAKIGVWLSPTYAKRVTTSQLMELREHLKTIPGFAKNPIVISANKKNGRLVILQEIPYRTSQEIQRAARQLADLLRKFLAITSQFISQRLRPQEIEAFCQA